MYSLSWHRGDRLDGSVGCAGELLKLVADTASLLLHVVLSMELKEEAVSG